MLVLLLLPGFLHAQAPRPEPRPAANTAPMPDPSPAPEPKPEPEPGPEPKPQPEPERRPESEPAPLSAETAESDGQPDQIPETSAFDHAACLLELSLLGAEYDEPEAITEPGQPGCGIRRPVRLHAPLPGLRIEGGGALMHCDTARSLAHWLRDVLRPAASRLPDRPALSELVPGSTYQCRQTIGGTGAKLSEHATGNAFDLSALVFSDGSRMEIAPRDGDGDMEMAFQQAIRAGACLYFSTVLGPGSNAAHDDHLHLDIKPRKGGFRLCQ
ncbi:extensin family protein [Paracoccus ravus]|uniref:extensin-like domain-containing protein n=1 Tax=Paracoccus ravus TaxID=2447760 RepID=UPI001FD6F416|nr:extensin family protein [Paracoccus ravus]